MATQALGEAVFTKSDPVDFHWHWYYHVPALPLWGVIGLLLVLPKANRNRQAWLIVLPAALVLVVWRMPLVLIGPAPENEEMIGFFVVTLVMSWSAVWLLGSWFGRRSRLMTLFLLWTVMGAGVLVSYACHFQDTAQLLPVIVFSAMGTLMLSLGITLTGWCCREWCSLRRLLLWLAAWLGMGAGGFVLGLFLCVFAGSPSGSMSGFFPAVGGMMSFLAVVLYLVNLPFVVLAFKSPFYQDRLHDIFHTARVPLASAPA